MKKLLTLFFLFSFCVVAQKKAKVATVYNKPKLIVGVVIDQMRYDYLYRYYDQYSEGGFKRLMREGFNCKNNQYHYAITNTGPGHTHVFSGSVPAISGIVGNEWYERSLGRAMYVAEDTTVSIVGEGNAKAGKMSPKNMHVTSICDQLKLATEFRSKVIGIAIKDRGAIMPAGHSANAAYWFDATAGNWISSSYYMKELPNWAQAFNAQKRPQKLIEQGWKTLLPIEQYTQSEADNQPYENNLAGEAKPVFPHELKSLNTLPVSPAGNTLTKEFALAALRNEQLGKGSETDFLTLSFSSPDYIGHSFGTHAVEIQDTYLRLDLEIADLLNQLDNEVGKGNYLFFLSADHGVADIPAFLRKNKIPAGLFLGGEISKIITKAIEEKHGAGKWVINEDNYQIYLNYALMKEKNVNMNDIYVLVQETLLKTEGIYSVVNLHNFEASILPAYYQNLIRNVYNPKRSGDLMVLPEPAWFGGYAKGTTHGTMYAYDTHVPLLFYGWKIKAGETTARTQICDIAPTIAQLLNILEPNGNVGVPIKEVVGY